MLKKVLLVVFALFFILPIVFSQRADIEVDYALGKGSIQISVNGEHSGSAEFYEGNYIPDNVNYVDPIERSKGIALLGCNNNEVCDPILFESVNIFEPGDYYFLVRDKNQIAERRNFHAALENLLNCEYNRVIIRNNECVSEFTNDVSDKPLFCTNQEVVPRCAGSGFCGCPSSEQICCNNENLEECRGRLGECVLPSPARVLEKEITEIGETNEVIVIGKEVVDGCLVQNVKVPNGICLNNVFDLNLQSSDSLFAQQCSCVDRSAEADLDGDRFDSVEFIGGRDCNDADPGVNPLAVESCSDETGFDDVDNNCDGVVDLDCDSYCDQDGDGYTSHLICLAIGKQTGDCNDNNVNVYPGAEEICGDAKENSCNLNYFAYEDGPGCICEIGEQESYGVIRNDGVRECVDGKSWKIIEGPDESPLVFINTLHGSVERGDVNLNVREEFEIEVKFLCPSGDCNVEVN